MDWAKNPDLDFINFELLKKDLDKYKNNPDKIKFEFFLRNVVFFKMLHEFTKTYRSLPPTAE